MRWYIDLAPSMATGISKGRWPLEPRINTAAVIEPCPEFEVLKLLRALPAHSIQLFTGIEATRFRDLLRMGADFDGAMSTRPILFMDLQGLDQSEAVLDRAIGQLAEVAACPWRIRKLRCDRHLEQTAAMVPPSIVVKDGMGGRRLARSFSRSAATERLVNAIFVVIISELFQLSPQIDCVPD